MIHGGLLPTVLVVCSLLCIACGGAPDLRASNLKGQSCTQDDQQTSCAKTGSELVATNMSRHLYLLALAPANAFSSSGERDALWKALQGDEPTIRGLLGPIEAIPMDYRIEYIFNHASPSSKEAELHRIRPWAKRISSADQARLKRAQTILLVKGDLQRLPNAQETRLTLAALVFLAERYDGVVFDLLNREALGAKSLRHRLMNRGGLAPQIRLIGVRVDRRLGIRTVGLPKYGLPDLFLASRQPKQHAKRLSEVVDALLESRALPQGVSLSPCVGTKLDYGCYEVSVPSRQMP